MFPAIPRQALNYVRQLSKRISTVHIVSPSLEEGSCYATAFEVLNAKTQVHTSLEHINDVRNVDVLIFNNALYQTVANADLLTDVLKKATNIVATDGIVIFREDLKNAEKHQVARLTDYFDVFRTIDSEGNHAGLDLYTVDQVDNSLCVEHNFLDFMFVFRKKVFAATSSDTTVTFRDFLDKTQYTSTGIDVYEWMFGRGFICPGGEPEHLSILNRFGGFRHGQALLDIGVGTGGGAKQAAEQFGLNVHAVDLSANMLAIALERVQEEKDARLRYSITDALVYRFEEESFDFVHSRDCIQHIPDVELLFAKVYKALKPGGKVLMTMYGKGKGEQSAKFKEYVAKRAYFLRTLDEIAEIAKKAGFVNVETENLTPRFKEILLEERNHLNRNSEEFLTKFTQRDMDSLICGWTDKLGYIEADNHNWNFLLAQKPLNHCATANTVHSGQDISAVGNGIKKL
ncbi:unnamed protein product [Caenorhabditis sp. 36 PRJEB53466]|nr:unnamed protein product [Caenorhabditis sp. 36 PRJEB53466]